MYRLPCRSRTVGLSWKNKRQPSCLSTRHWRLDELVCGLCRILTIVSLYIYIYIYTYIHTHTSFTRCMHWYLAPALIVWTGNGDHRPAQLDFQRVTLGPPGGPQETPKQLPGSPRTLLALTVAAGVSSLPQAAVQSAGWGASQRGARNQNALGCPWKHEKSLSMFQVFKWLWM